MKAYTRNAETYDCLQPCPTPAWVEEHKVFSLPEIHHRQNAEIIVEFVLSWQLTGTYPQLMALVVLRVKQTSSNGVLSVPNPGTFFYARMGEWERYKIIYIRVHPFGTGSSRTTGGLKVQTRKRQSRFNHEFIYVLSEIVFV